MEEGKFDWKRLRHLLPSTTVLTRLLLLLHLPTTYSTLSRSSSRFNRLSECSS